MTGSKPQSEKRSAQRMPMKVPATVRVANGGIHDVPSETRDISENGMFLFTDAEVVAGSEIEIVAMLPAEITRSEAAWVCCHARVVRVEEDGEQGGRGIAAVIERVGVLPQA
jgi:hypothetical protein